ncbi:uncharacterized protein LOC119683837 [Teleopsis dalmanni]|uniref:uncharacterized protein LOC119683836 n=1 Tax=Teleopsis dalmanni TaxID=139649 RepID=UPI0018CEAC8B|nr:uncharacterized protein LOC119683836 [Teleopsis dalmanni]XP_037953629.1 uncharacterized protein LOC119683837 [Teleopsis dalmanni]
MHRSIYHLVSKFNSNEYQKNHLENLKKIEEDRIKYMTEATASLTNNTLQLTSLRPKLTEDSSAYNLSKDTLKSLSYEAEKCKVSMFYEQSNTEGYSPAASTIEQDSEENDMTENPIVSSSFIESAKRTAKKVVNRLRRFIP